MIKPSDGSVLALAGLAVSAPQPPGSSFKIITAAAALQDGVAKISSSYPVRQSATLSGVKLRNASDEECGGSLTSSFAHSCNSVFGPIGAKLGAKKLVAAAERFGFNETPSLPAAKPNSIPKAADLKDSSPSARARSARTRTSPPRSAWPRSARRSPTAASASSRG